MKNSLRVCDYQNFLFSSFAKMLIIQLNDDFMEIYESAFMRLRLRARQQIRIFSEQRIFHQFMML